MFLILFFTTPLDLENFFEMKFVRYAPGLDFFFHVIFSQWYWTWNLFLNTKTFHHASGLRNFFEFLFFPLCPWTWKNFLELKFFHCAPGLRKILSFFPTMLLHVQYHASIRFFSQCSWTWIQI